MNLKNLNTEEELDKTLAPLLSQYREHKKHGIFDEFLLKSTRPENFNIAFLGIKKISSLNPPDSSSRYFFVNSNLLYSYLNTCPSEIDLYVEETLETMLKLLNSNCLGNSPTNPRINYICTKASVLSLAIQYYIYFKNSEKINETITLTSEWISNLKLKDLANFACWNATGNFARLAGWGIIKHILKNANLSTKNIPELISHKNLLINLQWIPTTLDTNTKNQKNAGVIIQENIYAQGIIYKIFRLQEGLKSNDYSKEDISEGVTLLATSLTRREGNPSKSKILDDCCSDFVNNSLHIKPIKEKLESIDFWERFFENKSNKTRYLI